MRPYHLLLLLAFASFPAFSNTLPTVTVTGTCTSCPSQAPNHDVTGRSLDGYLSLYLVMDSGSGDGGGSSYDEWYGEVTETNPFTHKLERVVINGSAMTNPATLCVGNICSDHSTVRETLIRAGGLGYPVFFNKMWGWLFGTPPIVAMSCNPAFSIDSPTRQTTSHDQFLDRQIAAGKIMMAYFSYLNTIGANKQKFVVIYSDGGTEEWEYVTINPARPTNLGKLTQGNGQSQCQNL